MVVVVDHVSERKLRNFDRGEKIKEDDGQTHNPIISPRRGGTEQ
jgi:hypothetical protein